MRKRSVFIISLLLISVFLLSFSSATCTLTLDKTNYSQGETVTVTANCDAGTESNKAYSIIWYNTTGTEIERDDGTTPSGAGDNFFETYIIPSAYVIDYGTNLTAIMNGTNLEGDDFGNVSSAGANDLIIKNISITNQILVGRAAAIHFVVEDENDKEISNARCSVEILDDDEKPILISETPVITLDGEAGFSTNDFVATAFNEGTQHTFRIHCGCPTVNTSLGCYDEDGLAITESVGSATFPFTINTWLNVSTLTDKSSYIMKNEITICANVTNLIFANRIPMEIFHQVRCSKELDNNDDLDRSLIISDDLEPDERGISTGTTQMQCKRFVIPEAKYLQGRNSQCYASTTTWVLNEKREKIIGYATTSPIFNITSTELNINPDWQRLEANIWNSVVNLSTDSFEDFNGTGTGNMDLKLNTLITSLNPSEQFNVKGTIFSDFILTQYIKTITVKNSTGTTIDHNLEVLDDGSIEIEVTDVDISTSGYVNVTIEFNDWYERQSDALENQSTYLMGIENKTGTFRLSVDCPPQTASESITCTISGKIEDDQIVQKEVDFTCYVQDTDGTQYGSTNWNQMITKSLYSEQRTFAFPNSLQGGQKVLQCTADYYNFGSRRDSFFDTFYYVIGSSSIDTLSAEEIIFEAEPKTEVSKRTTAFIGGFLILIIAIIIFLGVYLWRGD